MVRIETRQRHEVEHGQFLAQGNTETLWGWGTPAGRLRADRRARLIADGAGLRPGVRALEIGCGTGLFTAMFAASGADILAVDISPDLIAKARQRELPDDRIRFLTQHFEDCDVDGPFDAILGSSILHHLDPSAFRRIFELLLPGAPICFAEPNMLNPQIWLERHFRFLPYYSYISHDETAFVRWTLARELAAIGFVDITITPFDWLHPSTPPRVIPAVSALGRLLERTPGLRELSGSLLIRAVRPVR